jgi:glycosyltransferase involved in cell wall biosynthesis
VIKVCHLDTERSWRGGEQQLLYLARGLREAGELNLIAARKDSPLAERTGADGFQVLPIDPAFEWDPIRAADLRRALLAGRFDLLHAHTAHAAALGALATLGTTIPLIVSRRVDFHLSMNPLTHWKYRRAAKVLTVSSAIKDVLIQDGIADDLISVVYSGVDPARLEKNEPLGRREEYGLPATGALVGQVAALAPHKDPLNFVNAIAALKKSRADVCGVMVGTGPLADQVRSQVDTMGLSNTIHLLGFREDAHRLLRHFDVFVLSSHLEGLGTSILDAMVLGIPVVATRAGGIPEMVEDGVSGLLVPSRDPQALAAAIDRVLQDASLREKLRQGGYKTAERFTTASMVEATRQAYREVLGSRS